MQYYKSEKHLKECNTSIVKGEGVNENEKTGLTSPWKNMF
jgi:hypothetical protein